MKRKSEDFCERSIIKAQRAIRRYLALRSISAFRTEAKEYYNQPVQPDPTQEQLASTAQNQSKLLQLIPSELWCEIFAFIPEPMAITSMAQSCGLFHQISKINFMWMPCVQSSFPKVFAEIEEQGTPSGDVNWLSILKEKTLRARAFRQLIIEMADIKSRGNTSYVQREYSAAKVIYRQAIELMSDPSNNIDQYDDVVNSSDSISYNHLGAVLYANAAQVELKLENHAKALMDAVKAKKKLNRLKELVGDEEEFDTKFGLLWNKVQYRMREAYSEIGPVIRMTHFSDQPVEGIQQGSMLTHVDGAFRGGFFDGSKVLMTRFDDTSVVGVIINKYFDRRIRSEAKSANDSDSDNDNDNDNNNDNDDNDNDSKEEGKEFVRTMIGGPCEMSTPVILHNLPDIPGSHRVIDGVYFGGDQTQLEARQDEDGAVVRRYLGYASWFPGQLEGEIRNAGGWTHTNEVNAEDVWNPDPLERMDLRALLR